MGALAQLSESSVSVEPGRSATIKVTVRNDGTVVDRYAFEALGEAAPWVTFNPTSLSLFPEASGSVDIILSPPRVPTTTAGPVPLGVRVASSEDPDGSVVEEATIHVGAFSDVTVELVPSTMSGRVVGRARLAVDNRSNCDYRAELSGTDPKTSLGFSFRPGVVGVPPGNAVFVKLAVRPSRRIWRGAPRTQTFRVVLHNQQGPAVAPPRADGAPSPTGVAAEPANPHKEEVYADGSLLQEPLLPRWLLAVPAVLAALAILWFVLLRPEIRSTAQDQVNKQVSQALGAGTGNGPGNGGNATPVTVGPGGVVRTTPASGPGGSSKPTTGSGKASNVVSTYEIDGGRQATGNGTFLVLTVPKHQFLQITDLLVENAAGDSGILTLAHNGTTLMQWAMANFRDLDYHWITPTEFGPGTKVQLIVSGCGKSCSPGIYYAGHLVAVPG